MTDKETIRALAVNTLDENKAINISNIDVTALTDVTDYLIICTATSTRHAKSLADKLLRTMKNQGIKPLGIEGEQQSEWILVDLQDVVVHIMLAEIREFYDLEKLWTMTEEMRQQYED